MLQQNPGIYDYVITLQSPQHKKINLVSKLVLLLFLATFFMYLLKIGMYGNHLWLTSIPILIIGLALFGWVQSAKPGFQVHYRIELMIAALSCIMLPLFPYSSYLGWGFALLAIIERWVKAPFEIGFSREKISINAFPKKDYAWYEVENVIIKNNLFTLDLRNNKIIQKPLEEPIALELEAEFNQFCRDQLHFGDITQPIADP